MDASRQLIISGVEDYLDALIGFTGEDSFFGFVRKHGRHWTAQDRPPGYHKAEDKQCFANSQAHLLTFGRRSENLTYVEGYAISGELKSKGVGFPMHHGWLVDQDGKVIDLTWRSPGTSAYFGVPFKTPYVNRMVHQYKMWHSLIDHPADEFRLVRGETPPEEAIATWIKVETYNGP